MKENIKKLNIIYITTLVLALSFTIFVVSKFKKTKNIKIDEIPKEKDNITESEIKDNYDRYYFLNNALKYQKDTIPNFKISSGFGYRTHPVTGEKKLHNGIDIPLKEGTPIYAPIDGYAVIFSTKDGGKQLLLKNSKKNIQFGYAHLSDWKVKNGDLVKKGDLIALSGNTGKSTGPHIHLTIKDLKTNEYINPELYI